MIYLFDFSKRTPIIAITIGRLITPISIISCLSLNKNTTVTYAINNIK
ncbi:hypothetical protein JOC31_000854 [Streptococcus saliviloxodontae]|uniref:Uncharacterized protein n=1 Tax=Streptococcus saliviloxodontae TaxID=1349416 RepID=A0ABS2PKS7_9STRE|nr:hypothetical protein [Streptococcus saliviloxodontae]